MPRLLEHFEDEEIVYLQKDFMNHGLPKGEFCSKGQKYNGLSCSPCEKNFYQDETKPHRILKCHTQPTMTMNDCKKGEYFFKNDLEVNDVYENTLDRRVSSDDFCKAHYNFGAKDCPDGQYIKSTHQQLRDQTKNRELNAIDYCLPQPTYESLVDKCVDFTFFANKIIYDEIIAEKEKKVLKDDICEKISLVKNETSVNETSYDRANNLKSYRTITFKLQTNAPGQISIVPIDINSNQINSPMNSVAVNPNAPVTIDRVENSVGQYYFRLDFTHTINSQQHTVTLVDKIAVECYNFSFQLDSYSQHVRSGSTNFKHPSITGVNHENLVFDSGTFQTDPNKSRPKKGTYVITYTVTNKKGSGKLSLDHTVTVYDAKASIKKYGSQNVKHGHNYNEPEFNLTNMTVKYVSGMPGKHDVKGNAHTYTGTYEATDKYDANYKITLYPKVTKYKFKWPTAKDQTITQGDRYDYRNHWEGGINFNIIAAQYNWHPYSQLDEDWLRRNFHTRSLRFKVENKWNTNETTWIYATVTVKQSRANKCSPCWNDAETGKKCRTLRQKKAYGKFTGEWSELSYADIMHPDVVTFYEQEDGVAIKPGALGRAKNCTKDSWSVDGVACCGTGKGHYYLLSHLN